MSQVEKNQDGIRQNRKKLYELENQVLWNKAQAYGERSMIEENRSLILKNYAAAFLGNRQMANQNTDDIFRNRKAILQSLKASTPVAENFRNAHLNQAHIDYLEHRSVLNSRVVDVSEKLSEINRLLIQVNKAIMESNAELTNFNAKNIELNKSYLNGKLHPEKAKPADNAKLVKSNSKRISETLARANSNKAHLAGLDKAVRANRAVILKNSDEIYKRRELINKNHKAISENQKRIATLISSGS